MTKKNVKVVQLNNNNWKKMIVYSAEDSGVDGMSKPHNLYSSFNEKELDEMLKSDPSKAWRRKKEEIVDIEQRRRQALAKLDGIDRLVLDLPNWLEEK